MLPKEDNELLTHVGPGTPMGNLMRQYWIPSMMSTELPSPDCAPLRLRLLCENLIAFRTTSGQVGVVANACPHRGASLFFGRNEEEGLRCVYHGWKFDVDGTCVDMPSEPAESNFRSKVRVTSYPTLERSGLIWVYMGPRSEPPPLPSFVANMLPEGQYSIAAYGSECNWLQSLEGDFDTIHVGFLHRGSVRAEDVPVDATMEHYALKTRWARSSVLETDFGVTHGLHRPAEEGTSYWRIAQYLFPFYAMTPASGFSRQSFHAVVPVDDEHCLRFLVSKQEGTRRANPEVSGGINLGYHMDPSINTSDWLGRFPLAGNRRNDYFIDRDVQRANVGGTGYTGIAGRGQDGSVTESMGVIYQRDAEHLGVTDTGIIRMRRLLLRHARALRDNGTLPPGVDEPDVYRVRAICVVLPSDVNGVVATQDLQWGRTSEPAPGVQIKA